jgi:hypothetical protein
MASTHRVARLQSSPMVTWKNDAEIRAAIAAATANQRLEGIEVTPEEEELCFRHARGDITWEEFLRELLLIADRVAAAARS